MMIEQLSQSLSRASLTDSSHKSCKQCSTPKCLKTRFNLLLILSLTCKALAGIDIDIDMSSILNASEDISESAEAMGLRAFAQQLLTARLISCCILTLILLEIAFTFDKEVVYIWRRPWSLFKILFIHCRYLSVIPALLVISKRSFHRCYSLSTAIFLTIISPPCAKQCFVNFWTGTLACAANIVFTVWPGSCLLAIRLDRLYNSKLIRATLIALVFVESASQLAVALSVLPRSSLKYAATLVGSGTCAGTVSNSTWFSKSFVMLPYLALICIYIVIAWRAFIRHCHEKTSLSSMWAARKNFAPLYILFIRDGVVCYIMNLFGMVCGFLLLTVPTSTSELVLVGPAIIAGTVSISCCRLALLLHGNPGHATGVYQLDTNEFHVEMR